MDEPFSALDVMTAETLRTVVDELAGSEQRLRGLLDTAVDGVVELGVGDAVVRTNDAFRSMVGLGSQDVVGRTWQEVAELVGSVGAFAEQGHRTCRPSLQAPCCSCET